MQSGETDYQVLLRGKVHKGKHLQRLPICPAEGEGETFSETFTYTMSEAPEYKIEESWMTRVKEVVDYAYENQLYVIINMEIT